MSDSPWRHPSPLFALVAVAACEWFAYFALRSRMPFELHAMLGDQEAVLRVFKVFSVGSAIVPLLAGIAVDLGGARRMAIAGAALTAAGLMAVALPAAPAVYAGIFLVVIGKGLAQIGLLTVVADLYGRADHRRDAGFTLIWFGINVGSAAGPFAVGVLATYVASAAGFAAAGGIAVCGMLALAYWKPAVEPRAPASDPWLAGRTIGTFAVLVLVTLGLALAMATASLASTLSGGGPPMTTGPLGSELASIVAFAIAVLLLPLLLAWLWLRLGPRQPSSPAKILLGALLTAAGIMLTMNATLGDSSGLSGYLLTGTRGIVADILVVPIAVSLISRLAPPRLCGTTLGLWTSSSFLTGYAFGPLQGAIFEQDLHTSDFFLPGMALAAGVVGYVLLASLGNTRKR